MAQTNIIVNATALDKSGALSILRQFVDNIPNDNHRWLIFISDKITLSTNNKNVRLESISGVKSMPKRFWWDIIGLRKWLKDYNINPVAAISLQNTGFKVGKSVPSFIYYHQPLPFFNISWNPLKKTERSFWFYKYIYPFFVSLFLTKSTRIFVQLDFIRKEFARHFHHPENIIDVFSPSIVKPSTCHSKEDKSDALTIFYPAMGYFYKNHRVIVDALELTNQNIEVYFTTDKPTDYKQDNRIHWIGQVSYDQVCQMYDNCDAVVFPSYIETYGLPLVEAAMTGVPIIASDLPYAREVLNGYEGVTFVEYDNSKAWAKAINSLDKGIRYKPLDISNRAGWPELFQKIFSNL